MISLKINGVPLVCRQLGDQSNCETVLQYCSPNWLPEMCNTKLIAMHVIYGTPKATAAYYHATMEAGHEVLHYWGSKYVYQVNLTLNDIANHVTQFWNLGVVSQ